MGLAGSAVSSPSGVQGPGHKCILDALRAKDNASMMATNVVEFPFLDLIRCNPSMPLVENTDVLY